MKTMENDFVLLKEEKGIAYVIFKEVYNIDLTLAKDYLSEAAKLSGINQPMPVLMDLRKAGNITPGAVSQLVSEESTKITKASAILYTPKSEIVRIGMPLLLKITKQPFPVQFFTEEKKALEWLQQFVDK